MRNLNNVQENKVKLRHSDRKLSDKIKKNREGNITNIINWNGQR